MPTRTPLVPGAVLALALAAGAPAGAQSRDMAAVQKKRTATMKAINKNMRAIKVFVGQGKLAEVARAAEEVAGLTARIPELSPRGSAVGKTRIKPGVWENFDDYKALAARSAEAARDLARIARGTDRAAVEASFKQLARACTACHKPYRKKKKEKGEK